MRQLVVAALALVCAAVLLALSVLLPWDKPAALAEKESSSQVQTSEPSPIQETEDDKGVRLLQEWQSWEALAQEEAGTTWCGDGRVVNLGGVGTFVDQYREGEEGSCLVLVVEEEIPTSYQISWRKGEAIRAVTHTLTLGGGVQKEILTFEGIFERASAYLFQGYGGSLVIAKQSVPQWELDETFAGEEPLSADGLTVEEALEQALQVDGYLEAYLEDCWMNGREDAFDPRGTAIPPSILHKEVEPSRREGQVTGAARINGQHYYQVTLEETALRPQTVYFVQEADGGTVYRLTDDGWLTMVWDVEQQYYTW